MFVAQANSSSGEDYLTPVSSGNTGYGHVVIIEACDFSYYAALSGPHQALQPFQLSVSVCPVPCIYSKLESRRKLILSGLITLSTSNSEVNAKVKVTERKCENRFSCISS